jgi:hypothetical protein
MPRDQLNEILTGHLALDRARIFRRLLVVRCGLLALAVALLETVVHGFTSTARLLSVAIVLVPPCWAWIAELRLEWSLGQRLGNAEYSLRKS